MGYGNVDASTWTIGLNYIVSKPVKLENGFAFTPYGRLNVRSDNYSADIEVPDVIGVAKAASGPSLSKLLAAKATNSVDESDFNIGVNLGSVFSISSKVSLTGEVQIDDEVGFLAGITFFMW